MNLYQCREIIKSLKNENNQDNAQLIEFYQTREKQLIKTINDSIKNDSRLSMFHISVS